LYNGQEELTKMNLTEMAIVANALKQKATKRKESINALSENVHILITYAAESIKRQTISAAENEILSRSTAAYVAQRKKQQDKETDLMKNVTKDIEQVNNQLKNLKDQMNESEKNAMILGLFNALVGNSDAATAVSASNDPVASAMTMWRTVQTTLKSSKRDAEDKLSTLKKDILTSEQTVLVSENATLNARKAVDVLIQAQSHLTNVVFGLLTFSSFWERVGAFLGRLEGQGSALRDMFVSTLKMVQKDRSEMMSHPLSLQRWVEVLSLWKCLSEVSDDFIKAYESNGIKGIWNWVGDKNAKPNFELITIDNQ